MDRQSANGVVIAENREDLAFGVDMIIPRLWGAARRSFCRVAPLF